jgi:hypothetical protein
MKKDNKYDPEDLESLLMHKSFDELYPEEKEFVLKHLEGPGEYEEMRQTLLLVQREMQEGEGIEARPEIKERLLESFHSERKGGFLVWLNQFFSALERNRYKWAVPVAVAGMAIFVWFFIFSEEPPGAQLAENIKKQELKTEKEGIQRIPATEDKKESKMDESTLDPTEEEIIEIEAEEVIESSESELIAETTDNFIEDDIESNSIGVESPEMEEEATAQSDIAEELETMVNEEESTKTKTSNAASNLNISQANTSRMTLSENLSINQDEGALTETDFIEPSNLARPNAEAYAGIIDSFFTAY